MDTGCVVGDGISPVGPVIAPTRQGICQILERGALVSCCKITVSTDLPIERLGAIGGEDQEIRSAVSMLFVAVRPVAVRPVDCSAVHIIAVHVGALVLTVIMLMLLLRTIGNRIAVCVYAAAGDAVGRLLDSKLRRGFDDCLHRISK